MERIQGKMAPDAELKVRKAGVEGKIALKVELEAKGLGEKCLGKLEKPEAVCTEE